MSLAYRGVFRHQPETRVGSCRYSRTCVILCATFTRACRAERVDWLPGRSIAPPRLRPWVNACDRHPIAMPPRKPLYILVGMFYNPSRKTLLDRGAKPGWRARVRERASAHTRARIHLSARDGSAKVALAVFNSAN